MSAVTKVVSRTYPRLRLILLQSLADIPSHHPDFLHSYWDWSLDATPGNLNSTKAYHPEIFGPGKDSFGGNGDYVVPTPEQNPLNLSGNTGGGCVKDGAFTPDRFKINYGPTPGCLRRDFIPWIMNSFANPALVKEVLSQPDYTSFARVIEKVPTFDQANIHGSGHFGVGGILGTIGNAENSPAGTNTDFPPLRPSQLIKL